MDKRTFQLLGAGLFNLVLTAKDAAACAVCFGAADDPQTNGVKYGIFTLLVIVMVVLGLFSLFFINLNKRAQKMTQRYT